MKSELIYLGIGAAAVYFLSRKKSVSAVSTVSAKPEMTFTPGMPGSTPAINDPGIKFPDNIPTGGLNISQQMIEKANKQPIGIGPDGIVFGADNTDDSGSLTLPGTVDETIAKINSYAKQIGSTPADSFSILLDNAIQTNNNHGITILNQAWTKMNQPKKSMLVPAIAAAAGLYFITR